MRKGWGLPDRAVPPNTALLLPGLVLGKRPCSLRSPAASMIMPRSRTRFRWAGKRGFDAIGKVVRRCSSRRCRIGVAATAQESAASSQKAQAVAGLDVRASNRSWPRCAGMRHSSSVLGLTTFSLHTAIVGPLAANPSRSTGRRRRLRQSAQVNSSRAISVHNRLNGTGMLLSRQGRSRCRVETASRGIGSTAFGTCGWTRSGAQGSGSSYLIEPVHGPVHKESDQVQRRRNPGWSPRRRGPGCAAAQRDGVGLS